MWGLIASAAANILPTLYEGNANRQAQNDANARNREMQENFANNGIRMRVEDAKRSGINPALALGAQTYQAQPSYVANQDNSISQAASNMGQDIQRSISQTSTAQEKSLQALQIQNARLDIEGKSIDNAIRAQQLNNMSPNTPPMAGTNYVIPGQTSSGNVQIKPSQPTASVKPGVQAGVINDMQYVQHSDGSLGITPSTDAKERNEDDFVAETMWHARNRLNPPAPAVADYPLPKHLQDQGYRYWLWHPLKQKFIPSKNP